jgi:hypothetical protein
MKGTIRDPQDSTRGQSHPFEAPSGSFGDNRYSRYRWNWESINLYAPEAAGIYGLYDAVWIYVGQADSIRTQLLAHLDGDNPCITHYQPSGFAFELVSSEDHGRRLEEVIRQLEPLCKGTAFAYVRDPISDLKSGKRIRRPL